MPGWMRTGNGIPSLHLPSTWSAVSSYLRANLWSHETAWAPPIPCIAASPRARPAECSGGTEMSFWGQGYGVSHGLCRERAMYKSVCACEVSGSAAQILSGACVMNCGVTVWWHCSSFWSPPMTRWHKTTLCHHCSGTQWAGHLPKQQLINRPTQNVTLLRQATLLPFCISKCKKTGKITLSSHFSAQK